MTDRTRIARSVMRIAFGALLLVLSAGTHGAEPREAKKSGVPRLCDVAVAHARPEGAPKRSDVSMRLFKAWKDGSEFEVGKAFHITRGDWSYIYGCKDKAGYIRKVKALGWAFQGAMNSVTYKPEYAIKLRDGKPMLDHFQKPGRYWADMNNKDYRDWYVARMKEWVDLGADSIQRDEPTTCGRTPVRTAVAFFKDVHSRFEKEVGRKVALSCNMRRNFKEGGREPVNVLFDFGMAEFYRKDLMPVLIRDAARDAGRRGKALVYTGGGHLKTEEIRLAIAGCYANGINYIVPWDQFTGIKKPRLFGKPEDFADLYGFVRATSESLDGYEAAADHIPVVLRPKSVRQSLANELFGGRAFTVIMVSRSRDGAFGLGGNAPNGSGGIPRLYMMRAGMSYNVLKSAPTKSVQGELEITTFVHDGKNTIAVYRNGKPEGSLSGGEQAVKGAFGSGGYLSIPFNGSDRNHPGELAELLAFRGMLSAERLEGIHEILRRKYLEGDSEGMEIPLSLLGPELALHFSSDDLAGTHKDGQPITKWTARTGQHAVVPRVRLHNGKQAAGPTFRAKILNGHAAVQFDGVDDLVRVVSSKTAIDRSPVSIVPGTGSGRLCVFARAKPGQSDAPVVLHLVEWLGRAKAATIVLQREAFFGDKNLCVALLTPPVYDNATHDRAESSKNYAPLATRTELKTVPQGALVHVFVPALKPWGMLVVSPTR